MLKKLKPFDGKLKVACLALTVLALVGHGGLAITRDAEERAQREVSAQIELTRNAVFQSEGPVRRQQLLIETEEQLKAEQGAFPDRLSSSSAIDVLSNLAEASGLTVSEARTQAGDELEIGAHTYRSLTVIVSMEGDLGALRIFLSKEIKPSMIFRLNNERLFRILIISLKTELLFYEQDRWT